MTVIASIVTRSPRGKRRDILSQFICHLSHRLDQELEWDLYEEIKQSRPGLFKRMKCFQMSDYSLQIVDSIVEKTHHLYKTKTW